VKKRWIAVSIISAVIFAASVTQSRANVYDLLPSADGPMLSGGADGLEYSRGDLKFEPSPDLTICFCGSYFLSAEKGFESFYLFSDTINISRYVGLKVNVSGRPFDTVCDGTLLRICHFLRVTDIVDLTPTGTDLSTWGKIKSLFR
jgi:hypothetical protein